MFRLFLLVASLVVHALAIIQLVEVDYQRMRDRDGNFNLNASTYTRMVFDDSTDLLYVVSKEPARLTVFRVENNGILTELITHSFANMKGHGLPQDIELCTPTTGDKRLAISFDDPSDPSQPGDVRFYRPLTQNDLTLHVILEIAVGAQPVDMEFDFTCTQIVVACTGRPFMEQGSINDPPGILSTALLPSKLEGATISVTDIKFDVSYDLDNLEKQNFRHEPRVVDDQMVPVAQNVEPVNVILSPNGQMAYVAAPKNNAIFRVHLGDAHAIKTFPAGRRAWTNFYLDASDTDNVVHMENYPIYSNMMPKQIQWVTQGDSEWLITLDTGFIDSIPEYKFQDWGVAKDLSSKNVFAVNSSLAAKLSDDNRLGRAIVSVRDGLNGEGKISEVYLFGGRGITIHNGNTLEVNTALVDNLERASAQAHPNIFNTGFGSADSSPQQDKEATSPTFGPNLSIMETGLFENNKVLFLGSGSSGTIYVYVLVPDATCPQPFLHSLHRLGGQSSSWKSLYDSNNVGDLGMTDMLYIGDSLDHPRLLLVASATSNSVSSYRVDDAPIDLRRRSRL